MGWLEEVGLNRAAPKAWLTVCLSLLVMQSSAFAQSGEREVLRQGQAWLGYMSQLRLHEHLGLWNDAHFVPGAFYVLRTGLTVHPHERFAITGGYAFLGLPVGSVTTDLKRTEHRPWGQVVHSAHLGELWRIQQRVRYDARFRHNVDDVGLTPGYSLTHRLRYMLTFRRDLPSLRFASILPYVTFGNELLLNIGASEAFDQNRASAAVGFTYRGLSLQFGYMHRLVQLAARQSYVVNHTLTVWIFHSIDARRPAERAPPAEEEHEAPFGGV